MPVVVVVHEGRAHARAVVLHSRLGGHVTEAHPSVDQPLVVVEVLPAEVIGHQEIGPAVLVVVRPGGGEAEPVVVLVEPHLLRDVHEPPVPVVPEEDLWRAVVRVVVGGRGARLVLAHPDEVAVGAQVQVQEPVAVVVRHGRGGERALQRPPELEGVGIASEAPVAVVEEEQGPGAREQDQVLVAVVVHVREERMRGAVEDGEARGLGRVLEGAVALVAEEPVGQALGLGDVEVVQAIPIEIAHRHPVVPHAPRGEDRVQGRGPGVEPGDELLAKRRVGAQRPLRDLGEHGVGGVAPRLVEGDPLHQPPGSVRPAAPPHLPPPQPLGAPGLLAGAHEVETDRDGDERIRGGREVDGGDEELGHAEGLELVEEGEELAVERGSIPDQVGGHGGGPEDLEARATARGGFRGGGQPAALELGGQERVRRVRHAAGALLEERAQLLQACGQLLGLLLRGKRVPAGGQVLVDRLEGRRRAELRVVAIRLGPGNPRAGGREGQLAREEQDDPGRGPTGTFHHCGTHTKTLAQNERGAGDQPPVVIVTSVLSSS